MERTIRTSMGIVGLLMVAALVYHFTINKFDSLRKDNSKNEVVVTAKDRDRQLECLARNIYFEAGRESFEGKVAVAQVTINRSQSGKFPEDICAVVYQKTVFAERVVCQFTWYCENSGPNRSIYKETYNESYEVAKRVLLEGYRLPSLGEAIYYHATYVSPNWGKPRIAQIGNHIFYKG